MSRQSFEEIYAADQELRFSPYLSSGRNAEVKLTDLEMIDAETEEVEVIEDEKFSVPYVSKDLWRGHRDEIDEEELNDDEEGDEEELNDEEIEREIELEDEDREEVLYEIARETGGWAEDLPQYSGVNWIRPDLSKVDKMPLVDRINFLDRVLEGFEDAEEEVPSEIQRLTQVQIRLKGYLSKEEEGHIKSILRAWKVSQRVSDPNFEESSEIYSEDESEEEVAELLKKLESGSGEGVTELLQRLEIGPGKLEIGPGARHIHSEFVFIKPSTRPYTKNQILEMQEQMKEFLNETEPFISELEAKFESLAHEEGKKRSRRIFENDDRAAMAEIRFQMSRKRLAIPKEEFTDLVEEILSDTDISGEMDIEEEAVAALQTAAEDYIVGLLGSSVRESIHRYSDTTEPSDMKMTRLISEDAYYNQ